MNSMQIKDKIRYISKKRNVDFNTVFRLYMYDRFIERLSVSKYRDNFILKGGFYLSTLFGVEKRTTMDIDTAIVKTPFTEENIKKILEEIIMINISDNVTFGHINILSIRDGDEYGGYRAIINIKLDNIRESFQIDIAAGDPITPSAVKYKYLPVISDKPISLWAYNIETVLAEKLETILSRAEASSRTRDYYDIYLIIKMNFDKINLDHLKQVVKKTFEKREYNGDIKNTLIIIKDSKILKLRWESYSKKYDYASNICYEEIIKCLEEISSIITSELWVWILSIS